jgi:uncharacterized protein (UPF0264 family)
MRLLVSVRSAEEVGAAIAGGADIIDAKDPSRGSLGPVEAPVLRDIRAVVPPDIPLSVALGDFREGAAAAAAIGSLKLSARPAGVFVKLGVAGVFTSGAAASLFRAAVEAARAAPCRPRVVVVAYADGPAGLPPAETVRLAAQTGADGVLLDTLDKGGRDLFGFMAPSEVKTWVRSAQAAGLMAAIAGSLGAESLPLVREIRPGILGVRGAACSGGRGGLVDAEKVRGLRRALDAPLRLVPPVG